MNDAIDLEIEALWDYIEAGEVGNLLLDNDNLKLSTGVTMLSKLPHKTLVDCLAESAQKLKGKTD